MFFEGCDGRLDVLSVRALAQVTLGVKLELRTSWNNVFTSEKVFRSVAYLLKRLAVLLCSFTQPVYSQS